jgi:putative flippase GtrA
MLDSTVVRYALVGLLVAAAYLALFLLLRRITSLPVGIVSGIAFIAAVVLQYWAHATFTFERNLRDRVQAARFAVTVGVGFALSTLFVGWVAPSLGICELCALGVVTVTLPILNYVIFLAWVFVSRI